MKSHTTFVLSVTTLAAAAWVLGTPSTAAAPFAAVHRSVPGAAPGVAPDVAPMRAAVPADIALHGALALPPAPIVPTLELDLLPGPVTFQDQRVLQLHDRLSRALSHTRSTRRLEDGGYDDRSRRTIGTLEAIVRLIELQRFRYVGPPEAAPSSESDASVRYVRTQIGGLAFVFELRRDEFPAAFERA